MKKAGLTFSIAMFIGFVITNVGISVEANSAQKLKKITGPGSNATRDLGTKPTIFVPLTAAECTGLGGKVVDSAETSCASTGKACFVTNPDGVIRTSCITVN